MEMDFLTNHIRRSKPIIQELRKEIIYQATKNTEKQIQTPYVRVKNRLHYSSGRDDNKHQFPKNKIFEIRYIKVIGVIISKLY